MGAVKHKGNTNRANRVKEISGLERLRGFGAGGWGSVEEQRRVDGNLGCVKKP